LETLLAFLGFHNVLIVNCCKQRSYSRKSQLGFVAEAWSEFSIFRKKLGKTQKELAELLGTSLKAVSSYEQGWRSIPAHVERQIYFLVSRKYSGKKTLKKCWEIKNCPREIR